MSKKLAVLVIHGMGSQDKEFATEMINEVNSRLAHISLNPNDIAWKPIFWAKIVETKQKEYLLAAKREHDIDLIAVREFVISSLGDATAYQKIGDKENETYREIQETVRAAIRELYENDLGGQECPLIILAHSLGGHIMSCYIWDIQQKSLEETEKKSSFERLEHLAGFITFGCNIPLFTFAYKSVTPISFPGKGLSDEIKLKAKWLNYYDPQDVLGYPLKAINSEYDKVVDEDIAINVGNVFTSWNPISHMHYWTDNDFTRLDR
jgi:hypothetical protein